MWLIFPSGVLFCSSLTDVSVFVGVESIFVLKIYILKKTHKYYAGKNLKSQPDQTFMRPGDSSSCDPADEGEALKVKPANHSQLTTQVISMLTVHRGYVYKLWFQLVHN